MTTKSAILVIVAIAIVGSIYYLNKGNVKRSSSTPVQIVTIPKEEKASRYEPAKEITTPDGFVNTDGKPVALKDYIGKKVILIDFWTYSCINCQRTTPYLNSWYEKYKDKGLVIIGIHTPEFEFEKNYDNVKVAVEKLGIKFPVVLDNDFSTWTAYKNLYWPRKYLIDIDGYIVFDHAGEGQYDETEKKIQEALAERAAVLGENVDLDMPLVQEGALPNRSISPETYFGSLRNEFLNKILFLSGKWDIQPEFAKTTGVASVTYKYTAQNVFFVASALKETDVEVWIDGKFQNILKVQQAGLYTVVSHPSLETHTLELKIKNPGLEAFTFTFG